MPLQSNQKYLTRPISPNNRVVSDIYARIFISDVNTGDGLTEVVAICIITGPYFFIFLRIPLWAQASFQNKRASAVVPTRVQWGNFTQWTVLTYAWYFPFLHKTYTWWTPISAVENYKSSDFAIYIWAFN